MTAKEKVLKELQEFHECFYDESKSNTAELKRKRIEEYIEKSYQAIYELNEEKLAVMDELEALKRYPTQEEVCEAIQKGLEYGTVEYFEGNREFMFVNHGEKANITDCYGDRYKVTGFYKSSTITLIGRFYEGLK